MERLKRPRPSKKLSAYSCPERCANCLLPSAFCYIIAFTELMPKPLNIQPDLNT